MKFFFQKILLVTSTSLLLSHGLMAEIKTPNYDFSLALIEPFFPGKSVIELKKDKALYSEIFEDNGSQKILKFKLKKENYYLDFYTQVKNDVITDVFVRLPQHFNHDQFLTELQKRFKKQDKFVRKDLSALYTWLNKENFNILYHGSCSISCFPIFLEIVLTDKSVIPLYQKFNEALPKI